MKQSVSLILASLTLAFAPAMTRAETPTADNKIRQVERGLRPPNAMRGDSTWTLEERMEHHGVPGVGIAVIENHRVAWFRVYGLADRETKQPVRLDTLFQAGSISKPVAAFGAMKMVEQGKLSLDGAVNDQLTSWRIPKNKLTKEVPVTLTHLASHTGGLTVHGFPGYAVGEKVPSLVQVLDGKGPANTDAVRVDQKPGADWRYSGGGYTVMQQLMIDVGGKPFPALMQGLALQPIGMKHSTYLQPLPPKLLKHAAAGVLPNGRAVKGKRHTYPEMAAAGLWTTADDLARFAVEVQLALAGKSRVLSREMASKMVEPVVPHFGRGFAIDQRGGGTYFQHGGWDEGFCAQLTAHQDAGYGVVVMINSNHPAFIDEVVSSVAMTYGWQGYEELASQPIPKASLSRFPGTYRYNNELSFTVTTRSERLFMQYVGSEPQELLLVDDVFVRRERGGRMVFTEQDGELVFEFLLAGDQQQIHPRVAKDEILPRRLLADGKVEQAMAAFRKLQKEEDPAAQEGYLNNQGLQLVEAGNTQLGIELLRINCQLYPKSANTWDSVGYAYRAAGNEQKAIEYYKKALAIDPKFGSAVEAMAVLTAKKN